MDEKTYLDKRPITMTIEESIWIKSALKNVESSSIRNVLDVGSSTRQFRTQVQSYIDRNVFKPLRKRNISISYLDKKESDGVDYVFDIENISTEKIKVKYDLVFCCNLLEHVKKLEKVCCLLMNFVREGGFLLVTIPHSYRYHADPIDTGFRPSMDELISIFPGMKIIRKDLIYVKDKKKYKISELFRYIIPALNWKINCLLMKKN